MLIRVFRLLRKKYYRIKALHTLGYQPKGIYIGGKSVFTSTTHIGNNCSFNGIVVRGKGNVTIGDNLHSGTDILIMTDNHNYDCGNVLPYDDTLIIREVVIGKNVWLGTRVTILPGAIIEDGVVVQAGSTVVGRLPYCSVCGGHPAKPFKYRNIDHYETLLNQE